MKQISLLLILCFVLISSSTVLAADGLVSLKSSYAAEETMNRFEAIAKNKGSPVFPPSPPLSAIRRPQL